MRDGFDIRVANNGAIGTGIYFGMDAFISLGYSTNNSLLLCRVAVGIPGKGVSNLR
jgi:hypothetical protein